MALTGSIAPRAALALPYLAVFLGLYVLHSAWVAILLYHAGIVFFLARGNLGNVRERVRSGWSARAGMGLCLLGASAGPLLVLLWPWVARDPASFLSTLTDMGLRGTSWRLFAFYYVLVHPVLEEAFWRNPAFSREPRPGLRDVAFAGYHALVLVFFLQPPWAMLSVLILTVVSWIWRRTADRRGGLAVPVLSHAVAGLSVMAAASILARR